MNEKEYLPLYWKEHFTSPYENVFKKLSVQEMRILTEDKYPDFRKEMVLKKKPKVQQAVIESDIADKQIALLTDMNIYSLLAVWNKNKQIFKMDGDFLEELMKTETIHFSKNAWNFLPCDTFYIDISENQKICQQTGTDGFFVRVTECPKYEAWQIHIVRTVGREKLDYGNTYAWNKDMELNVADIKDDSENELLNTISADGNLLKPDSDTMTKEERVFMSVLVAQLLTYLASVEPDVRESETVPESAEQKEPAKKQKKSAMKDTQKKQSAVKLWNVGLRFGSSFRKWKNSHTGTEHSESAETGRKVRPHHRNAHWQNYWYGKKDGSEERIRRPKWVNGCFVNMNLVSDTEELPAVIHEVA